MPVGGCRPLGLWYKRILLLHLPAAEGTLGVIDSLDLFLCQHIGIDGSRFERLVTKQFLGGLDVACHRLNQRAEGMSGAME